MKKQHHFRSVFFFLICAVAASQAMAGTTACIGITPGNWSSPGSWLCDTQSGIPESDTNVQLAADITLDVDASINALEMNNGFTLLVANSPTGLTLNIGSSGSDINQGQFLLLGDFNIQSTGFLEMGLVDGGFALDLQTTGSIGLSNVIGGTTPLSSISLNSDINIVTLSANVTTTGAQTYHNVLGLENDITLVASEVNLYDRVESHTGNATGFNLIIDGNANIFNNTGVRAQQGNRGNQLNLLGLTVNGTTLIDSKGPVNVITDGKQEYFGAMTITADTTFESTGGSLLKYWEDIDASGHHLVFNTSGSTYFTDANFLGDVIIQAASVTTDAAGITVVEFRADFQVNSDDTATTFNDSVRLGPSTYMEVNQTGAADTIFNDELFQTSGGQKYLEVNDVSGQTIFNGDVFIGRLITNDGAGDDVTIINTANITTDQGGSNDGVMMFNDPVQVMQDVTFAEQDNGSITFNNTLDEANGVSGININIDSDGLVALGPVGTNNSIGSLTTATGGQTMLYGDIYGNTSLTFNDNISLESAVTLSFEDIIFNQPVVMSSHNLTLAGVNAYMHDVVSGSGDLIAQNVDEVSLYAENTYTGKTIINDGDLDLASAPSQNNINASSEIYLAAGSTLIPPGFSFNFDLANGQVLSGDGNVIVNFSATSGSTISPGTSPGALTFDSLDMDTGSTYLSEINGLSAGSDYDQLIAGAVELDGDSNGGATLLVEVNTDVQNTDEFIILSNTGVSPIGNTFNGLPEGATVTANDGTQFSISYVGGDGNDVVLSGLCSGVITVTNDADSGPDTLRQAVLDVCPGGSIQFAADFNITLGSEIELENDVTIDGSGHVVTISGGNNNRIFNVDVGVSVNLNSLNIINGTTPDEGGGIINNGNLTIVDSTFDGHVANSGPFGGGAIFNSDVGTLNVTTSTFTNNTADKGGAIFNNGGSVNIEISTFTQNGLTANEGGAIHNRGTLITTNVTIAGNGHSNTTGSGLSTWDGNHSLNNTLIADNNSILDCYIETSNSSESNSHSLIESGNCDADLTDDPQLQGLANNGGNTQTMALALTSPAVDAGSDALCTAEDQRGVLRPQLDGCDIGAYETEYLGIIRVNQNSVKQRGVCMTGNCWPNAYDNLQDALEVAGPGSQIWVAAGVYLPDVGMDVEDDDPAEKFYVPANVSLYGGFAGIETDLEQRDFSANLTVLSGDIEENDTDANGDGVIESVSDINGTNAYNVLYALESGMVLDGFTITAGYANGGPPPYRRGGAMFCSGSASADSQLRNITFQGNWSLDEGGALFGCNGNITDSSFINNESSDDGGAASFTSSATPVLENVRFISNQAASDGGAIYHQGIMMDRVYFAGNIAASHGGAIYASNSTEVSNSLFSGNIAGSDGGAVYALAPGQFTNVTLTGNVAVSDGGAIYQLGGPVRGDSTAMQNIIVWHNEDSSGVGTLSAGFAGGGELQWSHSLLQGSGGSSNWNGAAGNDAGNNIDLDPDFVMDVDLTAVPTVTGNARLLMGSAAIGTGDNGAVQNNQDLDGNVRIDGGTVDMGAYEYNDLIFANGFD